MLRKALTYRCTKKATVKSAASFRLHQCGVTFFQSLNLEQLNKQEGILVEWQPPAFPTTWAI